MSRQSDFTIFLGAIIGIPIGIIIGWFIFQNFSSLMAHPTQAPSQNPRVTQQNEETREVIRDEKGFVKKIIIHRKVESK